MAAASKILGTVIDHDDQEINVGKIFKGKTIGLYFSAHWCRTCQGFLPILKDFYKQYHETKNFEIVFISVDRNKESFHQHFDEMPWYAKAYTIPKSENNLFEGNLFEKFKITKVPTLTLMDASTGEIYTENAGMIAYYKENDSSIIEKFPFKNVNWKIVHKIEFIDE